MKILLLALVIPALAHAEVGKPWNPCDGTYCPEEVQRIADEMMSAGAPEKAAVPFVASGECHHLSPYYNPEHEHYGVALLDLKDGRFFMGGLFGFFYSENPWSDWTVEMVRERSTNLYAENHLVTFYQSFAYADMNPGGASENQMKYWYRQRADKFYILGQWGNSHTAVCRLTKHSQ